MAKTALFVWGGWDGGNQPPFHGNSSHVSMGGSHYRHAAPRRLLGVAYISQLQIACLTNELLPPGEFSKPVHFLCVQTHKRTHLTLACPAHWSTGTPPLHLQHTRTRPNPEARARA
jgi:hypothetical protein